MKANRLVVVAVVAGLTALGLSDPLLRHAPVAAPSLLMRGLMAPGLAARLLVVALAGVALAADYKLAQHGLPAGLYRAGARCLRLFAWAAPAVAGVLTAHGAADVWSAVLGGRLDALAFAGAWLLLGASAPIAAPSRADPALPAVLYWMAASTVLAFALTHRLCQHGGETWESLQRRLGIGLAVGVGCGLGGAAALWWAREAALGVAPAVWWLASLGSIVIVSSWTTWRTPGRAATAVLLLGILLLGFQLRWDFLNASGAPIHGLSLDGQSYFDEALDLDRLAQERDVNLLTLFFGGSTWFREPLFIYVVHGWMALLAPQELHQMYLTILASLAWVLAAAAAVGALLGYWPALLTALLLAIDSVWIRNAAAGLREEVTGTLLAAAVAALFSPPARRLRLDWSAPWLVAAAGLTRLDALPFGLFVLAWAALAQRWRPRRALLMAGLLAVVLVPAFAGYARTRGTATPAATAIATNNWQQEFEDRLGTPGFERDRQVTAFEYLFRYHTPWQIAEYTARGTAHIYGQEIFQSIYYRLAGLSAAAGGWGRYLGLESPLLAPLVFLAGGVGLLLYRRRTSVLPVALCLVGVLPPISFSAGVPGHQMYQARYGYMVAPFASAILAWALCQIVPWRYVEARDAGAPLPARLASLWRHRRLLRRLAERDLRQRYVGSALGLAWATINPLLFVAIYALIFTFVFGGRLSPEAPTAQYALYVISGLLPWVAFSDVAGKATQTMAEHRNLVKFVVFPVQILPLTSLYATALSQLVGLAALLALAAWVRGGLDASIALLPIVVVLQIVFLAGVAWLLGALGSVFRDVKEMVTVLLMVGMFLTPIFYVESLVPRPLRVVVELNPLAHLVRLYRDAFMGGGFEHSASLVVFAIVAGAALVGGFLVFERTRVFLADIL